jgi:hypothetical protein
MNIQMIGRQMRLVFAGAGAALIGTLALAPGASAQSQLEESSSAQSTDPSQMIEQRVAMLTSHLQLYSGQVIKLRAIFAQEYKQIVALRSSVSDAVRPDRSGPGPRSARSAPPPEVRSIQDRTEREVEKVLSAQQLAAYRALKEGRTLSNYLPQIRRGGFST